MTSKGSLRIHPMDIDGWVSSFAPFHNVNCPNGFLYFNKQVKILIFLLCVCERERIMNSKFNEGESICKTHLMPTDKCVLV